MPSEKEVYKSYADRYEQLVYCEDYQENIPEAIRKIKDFQNLNIVELGAGTGRLTRYLVKSARRVYASDLSLHMLNLAQHILQAEKAGHYDLTVADMLRVPLMDAYADMVIAGWSFCYLAVWGGEKWEIILENGLQEVMRLLRPGGTFIVLENFGTGFEAPSPPEHLQGYFEFLKKKGFKSNWLRTDYRFESLQEAGDLSSFFFGDDLSAKVKKKRWQVLPECTGIFWSVKEV